MYANKWVNSKKNKKTQQTHCFNAIFNFKTQQYFFVGTVSTTLQAAKGELLKTESNTIHPNLHVSSLVENWFENKYSHLTAMLAPTIETNYLNPTSKENCNWMGQFPAQPMINKLMRFDIFGPFFNPKEEDVSSLQLNCGCCWRGSPHYPSPAGRKQHLAVFIPETMSRTAPRHRAALFAGTGRNIDRFYFWFCFARRLFWSSSSGLAGDSMTSHQCQPTSLQALLFVTTAVCSHFGDGHFVFVNFGLEANIALRWSPTSCGNLFLITHSLTDEVLEEVMQHK